MTDINENEENPSCKLCMTPDGTYLGMFCGLDPDVDWIIAPSTPPDSRQKWDFVNEVWLPLADPDALAYIARWERDRQLREVYDIGLLMAQRALRMASTQQAKDYAQGKIEELDSYATSLQGIPEQASFPFNITWPTVPTL